MAKKDKSKPNPDIEIEIVGHSPPDPDPNPEPIIPVCNGCSKPVEPDQNKAAFKLGNRVRIYHLDCYIHKAMRIGIGNILGL